MKWKIDMRYQSPPCLPQVKQETIRERAARHRQERQAELRSTIDSDARSAAHRAKVQEERAKYGDQTSAQENVNRMVTRWLFPLPVAETWMTSKVHLLQELRPKRNGN
ncbi:hypothetical protein [Vibrio ostreicida]|uniref:hypothetical protein n=1 Tax=Vibrio ostreicida TaxID=526588 RepID=UPI0015C34CBE|nr:hypothetical protein [Vibrio ostreicida]